MMKTIKKASAEEHVVYSMRSAKEGQSAFSDVRLPNGTIIRRVNEAVHKRALANAAKAFKEHA